MGDITWGLSSSSYTVSINTEPHLLVVYLCSVYSLKAASLNKRRIIIYLSCLRNEMGAFLHRNELVRLVSDQHLCDGMSVKGCRYVS